MDFTCYFLHFYSNPELTENILQFRSEVGGTPSRGILLILGHCLISRFGPHREPALCPIHFWEVLFGDNADPGHPRSQTFLVSIQCPLAQWVSPRSSSWASVCTS